MHSSAALNTFDYPFRGSPMGHSVVTVKRGLSMLHAVGRAIPRCVVYSLVVPPVPARRAVEITLIAVLERSSGYRGYFYP